MQKPSHGQSHPRGVLRSLFLFLAGVMAIPTLLLSLVFTVASCAGSLPGENRQPTPTQGTTSVQIAPTPTAPTIPTPTPTPTKEALGTPMLGANIDAFEAKYGEPGAGSNPAGGHYVFSGADNLDVTTNKEGLVIALLLTPAQTWGGQDAAISACMSYAPDDAVYKNNADYDGGIQRIYQSAKLSTMLPASSFLGQDLSPTAPGTFGLTIHPDGSTVLSCSVQTTLEV